MNGTQPKYSDKLRFEVLARWVDGASIGQVANDLRMSYNAVYGILHRKLGVLPGSVDELKPVLLERKLRDIKRKHETKAQV